MTAQIHPGTSEISGHDKVKSNTYCKGCQLNLKKTSGNKKIKHMNKLLKKCSGIFSN